MYRGSSRRAFLAGSVGMALTVSVAKTHAGGEFQPGLVMTVLGPIDPREMGRTLPHEHVLVDFIGAEEVSPDRYVPDEVLGTASPHLERIRKQGVRTFVDCTPAYLGRDAKLLRDLSMNSGLHIITNTGYYGANGYKHLPPHALRETSDELAGRWLLEWREGIDDTNIRPGFLKIGVNAAPLPEIDRKLVRAAARTHAESGLTIASHTGDGAAALEQIALIGEEGVDPSAFVWVHAQSEDNTDDFVRAGHLGAWVEFDGIGPDSIDRHVELVRLMKDRGLLGRTLISQDAGWYHVGERNGGRFRPYDTLIGEFLPRLKSSGFTDGECQLLTIDNPREAFSIRVRS